VLDAGTGTLKMRCVINQPRTMRDPRNPLTFEPQVLVSPGMFVRVRLPVGSPHPAVLIAEKAIGTDQGEKYVYVVNGGKIERRAIRLGQMHNGLRVVDSDATSKVKGVSATTW